MARALLVAFPLLALLLLVSCSPTAQRPPILHEVKAELETDPVADDGDAADDPAMWVHPTDISRSMIVGTDKKAGLRVYDLEGRQRQFLPDGLPNNVDLRYGFMLAKTPRAIVGVSDRRRNGLLIYAVDDSTGLLSLVSDTAQGFRSGVDEVYGICLYQSRTGDHYAFVNGKNGTIEQWRLADDGRGLVTGEVVRTLRVPTQPEGMVADDATGRLYVGEEQAGVWLFGAEPADSTSGRMVATKGPELTPDVEGLALAADTGGARYLVVSSQGNATYSVYDISADHAYRGSFAVVDGPSVDGTQETDGIEISSVSFGPRFPQGMFIAQDGSNPGSWQNFKLVSWETIARSFSPPLALPTAP
jgi:3-phytase